MSKQVYKVQKRLTQLGFFSGKIDGIKGPITNQAIKNFQVYSGIQVDGIIGPVTRQKLFGSSNVSHNKQKKQMTLQISYYCSSCNFEPGYGYGSLKGCCDNYLQKGVSVATNPSEPCYKYNRQIWVNGQKMIIHDNFDRTKGRVDIWKGQKPLQQKNNQNCDGCNNQSGNRKKVTIQWFE